MTFLAEALTLALFAGSCLLWGWGIVRLKLGKPVLEFAGPRRRPRDPLLFVAAALFYLLAHAAVASLIPPLESNRPVEQKQEEVDRDDAEEDADKTVKPAEIRRRAVVSVVSNAVLVGGLLLMLAVRPYGAPPGEAPASRPATEYGITFAHLRRQILDGCLGFLAAAAPVGLVLVLTAPLREPELQHDLLQLLRAAPSGSNVLLVVVAAVVFAPLAEELLFRVFIQGWLQPHGHPVFAVVLSSAVFCLAHDFPDSLPLFPLAVILGTIYYRRNSYIAVVVAHALFNAANLALLMLTSGSGRQ